MTRDEILKSLKKARDAAGYAAWYSARSAARSAAWDAARSAAWDAACYVARSAEHAAKNAGKKLNQREVTLSLV
jgi:hypothetical protein